MKKYFILSMIGHFAYLYIFHTVFLPEKEFEIIYVVVSCFSLIYSFYFYLKGESIKSIIFLIIYTCSFSMGYLLEILIKMKYYTAYFFFICVLLLFSVIAITSYFYYFIKRLYEEEMDRQDYIRQIEKEIYESFIHVLRHDFNEKLYRIENDIVVNDKESAMSHLRSLMKESYQNDLIVISDSSSLNHVIQLQVKQYEKEDIQLSYFVCKIDSQFWDEKYTVLIYRFLEELRIPQNDVVLYLSTQNNCFVCKIISSMLINYQPFISKKIDINVQEVVSSYVYTIQLPFSE